MIGVPGYLIEKLERDIFTSNSFHFICCTWTFPMQNGVKKVNVCTFHIISNDITIKLIWLGCSMSAKINHKTDSVNKMHKHFFFRFYSRLCDLHTVNWHDLGGFRNLHNKVLSNSMEFYDIHELCCICLCVYFFFNWVSAFTVNNL